MAKRAAQRRTAETETATVHFMSDATVKSFKRALIREGVTLKSNGKKDVDKILKRRLNIAIGKVLKASSRSRLEGAGASAAQSGRQGHESVEHLAGSGIPAPSFGGLPYASAEGVASQVEQPHMLSAVVFAARLCVTRETVNTWRQSGRVIGVTGAKRGYRYPAWQISERGRPYEAIAAIVHELDGDQWAAWQFLEEIVPEFGEIGFRALAEGREAELLAALKGRSYGSFS